MVDPFRLRSQRRRPRLTTRSTFEFVGSTCPGLRLWPITIPLRFARENTRVTVPVRQYALLSADLATASCLPITRGTRQRTGGSALRVIENVCPTHRGEMPSC